MKTSRRILSVLMSVSLLLSLFVGTMAFSAAAETVNGGIVSFRSPAILANVGDKIDLSKYGVEFAEGVNTTEGLTWWKEGVSGLSVPYANPAMFANVGDTVNLTDYKVEMTEGNMVAADKLTWTQNVKQAVIPANNLILQAEAGATVDLRFYAVEGMGANLSWALDSETVTEITAKAGDLLTVSDGSVTKQVVVATRDGDTNNYVVYENDFNEASDIDSITRAPFGGSADQVRFTVSDGAFHFDRASSYSSGQENAAFMLPTYLWELSNYNIEWKASVIDYIKKGTSSTSQAGTTGIGLFINGDTTIGRPQHFMLFTRANKLKLYTRTDATKYADSLTLGKEASVMSNFSKATWVAFKVKIENGTNATFYYDYDTEADPKGPSGTYSKIHTYDFAAVEGQTHFATKGAMGFTIYHGDWDLDDIKITVPAIEYATQDGTVAAWTYTVAEKGVFPFNVTDGTTTRVVYLVTKNAEDTEYVLYENDFSEGLNGIERAGIGGDESKFAFSVENGVFSAVRAKDYVSSVENTSLILPAYLWDFTNLSISFKTQFTDWAKKDNGTSQKATAYVGLFVHGDTTNYRPQHLVTFNPASNLQTMTRIDESKYAASETLVTKYNATVPNLSKNQWIGYKVDVEGSKVTAYTDFDDDTATMTGEFVKRVEHDFATVDGQTWDATTGAIGLAFFRSDADIDDIKVTIPAEAAEPSVELLEITAFTPAEAGVTPITVKCGDVEKTIYIVAKNAADTEYVLYENNFDSEEDLADLTVLLGEADMTVADGKMTLAGKTALADNGGDGGAYIRLPEWLGEFGDYEIAANVVRAGSSTSEAFGFFMRADDNLDTAYLTRIAFKNASDALFYGERMPELSKPRTYTWGYRTQASMSSETSGQSTVVKMGMAGDTLTLQAIDMDDVKDDNYLVWANEQKTLRSGDLGIFISEVTVYMDYVRVTLPAVPNAPTAATFTPDADLAEGTIAGTLDVTLPGTGITPSDVIFYWGNGEGKLPGYAGFEKMLVTEGATELSYTIPAGTAVPAGATELRVYAMNLAGESTDCIVIPLDSVVAAAGEKIYSFALNSDWHIAAAFNATTGAPNYSTANNDAHFVQLMERIKAADPSIDQIVFGGDIVDGQKGAEAEYARLVELWNEYAEGFSFDGVIGNHEYWFTSEEQAAGNDTYAYTVNNFANYMNVPITPEKPYYSKTIGGMEFFFLNTSERDGTSKQSHNDSTLGTAQLEWLDAGLAEATANGKPAFVLHHQPTDQIVDATALTAVLKKYPTAIFVTSHSHEDANRNGIFTLADDAMCNQINTSAITFVIPTHYNTQSENSRNMSQGFIVDIYEDRVVFKGMDMMTGEWLPSAQFSVAYEAAPEHVCDFAEAKYDENNHWNECSCGEKADVAAHEFDNDCDTTCDCGYTRSIEHNYATTEHDADGHWTVCACDATTEKVAHDFANGDCACGEQAPNTAAVKEDKIVIKVEEGYELKAGSLVLVDEQGNRFVPTRVGFREGGDALEYAVPAGAVGAITVEAEFYQPTADNINVGCLGTSVNEEKSGLRFIHRVNVAKEGDKLYMTVDGAKKEAAKYGLLIAAQAVLRDPERLTLEVAADSMHVHQIDWPVANKYYDTCADYSDISVQVTGIADANAQNVKFITRTYVEFADGTVAYGEPIAISYNEHYSAY